MGTQPGGPPNKFPQWVDLTNVSQNDPAAIAAGLGIGYQLFYDTFGVWPTVAIPYGPYVYLGAYGRK
jgi:hypothetical protein